MSRTDTGRSAKSSRRGGKPDDARSGSALAPRSLFWPTFAVVSGLALFGILALLEKLLGASLVASVLLEEGFKSGLLVALALSAALGKPAGRQRQEAVLERLCVGLAAIAIFATTENIAYFLAFPGGDILLRLLWSEPAHLVSGLAEAVAARALCCLLPRAGPRGAGGAAADRGRRARLWAELLLGLGLALAWHLSFNALADSGPPALFRDGTPTGAALAAAAALNLTALIVTIRYFAQRAIVGGFLYGDS